jgi:hypothetical protein
MLVSNRFTKSITSATRQRFEAILDNSQPMTRREANRGAVVAVQAALADLNKGYMMQAEVDGFFGSRSAEAVELFQRDYGLFADGVVGRQTLTELDQIFSSDLFRAPQGMSVHVGVNHLDEDHYGGTFPLAACVNDATDFSDLAVSLGYEPILLANEDAITANFSAAMRQAVANLFSGDYLFVTFSGHGSQVANTSADEEADLLDETLCFYDRMLIDDELYALLSELRPGVNVTMVYDSCHSATVSRMIAAEDPETIRLDTARSFKLRAIPVDPDVVEGGDDAANRFIPFDRKKLDKALKGDHVDQPAPKGLDDDTLEEVVNLIVETNRDREAGAPKSIAFFSGIYERNRALYDAVKSVVGNGEDRDLECVVVALSACQDNQTTLDGTVNGFFTGNILSTWDGGGFNGSYKQMHVRLQNESTPTITPAINTYGGKRAAARLHERPFAF